MNNPSNYINNFLSFHNPLFFALIVSVIVIWILVFVYAKYIYPLQKKLILENQRYLTEKAELMALFAEMDPDPLIRIDLDGNIIQTNEESRKIFRDIEKSGKNIHDIIPSYDDHATKNEENFVESIRNKIYSVSIKKKTGLPFRNIYMHNITALKKYENLQKINQRRLKLLTEKLDSEIEELKNNLSADLHDDIGQRLIMIRLKLSDHNKVSCNEIDGDVEFIYNRIRSISRSLRLSDINNLGLKLSLQSLIDEVTQNSEIEGSFDFYGSEGGLDHKLLTCVYRIAQEAINNIVKHSKAQVFSIQISIKTEKLNMIISDNGRGIPKNYFEAKEAKIFGTGLFSIKERIEKFNGKLKIESNPKMGTNLFIEIPRIYNEGQ